MEPLGPDWGLLDEHPLRTVAGAFAGAMPPLIGWAAASGSIAWMYREDYAQAGYFVLPAKRKNAFLAWLTAVPSILLLLASYAAIKPVITRLHGSINGV
jgi:heme O synthase-like polyprenyltransferase